MSYLFLDNEMGGLEMENYSLLTTYLLFTDDDFNPVDDLALFLKPDDGIYKVCGEAMNVNRIDLKVHEATAITYKEADKVLYTWLNDITNKGKFKPTPVGHGVWGDINWINYHLLGKKTWDNFVSYRKLDTQSTCQFLKTCGKFPADVSGSLESIARYFSIPVDENQLHTAKTDTLLTLEVFKALRANVMDEPQDDLLPSHKL